jgi:hypothetical protein
MDGFHRHAGCYSPKKKKCRFRNEYHYEKSNILGAPKLDDSGELLRNADASNRRQQPYKSPSKGSQRISTSVLSICKWFSLTEQSAFAVDRAGGFNVAVSPI